jgi:hypothetical protein
MMLEGDGDGDGEEDDKTEEDEGLKATLRIEIILPKRVRARTI